MTLAGALSFLYFIAFIADYKAIDKIISHLKLTFVAEKPLASHVFTEVALMAAEFSAEYF